MTYPSTRIKDSPSLIHNNELPPLPNDWAVERFRFVFRESKERNGDKPVGEMLSVSEYWGIVPKNYEHEEQQRTDEELQSYRVVRPGQLVVNTMWLNHLGLGVSEHLGYVSPAYAVYEIISKRLDARFVHHLLKSQHYLKIYLRYLYGIRPNSFQISTDDWNSIPVIMPPIETQKAIAGFLDNKTAHIDRLIEKKEQLIELLQEKSSALICQAVTKGLNPDAPMRNSGIKWLGKIPAHWEIKRLKGFADVQLSNVDKKTVEGQTAVRLCNYVDVYYKEKIAADMDFMLATATPEQVRRFSLRGGDILITKDSETWTDIAVPAVVTQDLPGILCGYHLAHIRPHASCDSVFLGHVFAAVGPRDQYYVAATGITRFGLTRDSIRDGVFAMPPLSEQRVIATFLDQKTEKINALVTKNRKSIELLKELRTSLISAAVTGKIDLRKAGV